MRRASRLNRVYSNISPADGAPVVYPPPDEATSLLTTTLPAPVMVAAGPPPRDEAPRCVHPPPAVQQHTRVSPQRGQ